MAELGIEPRNQVRFAWWGAEESGLIGSQYYVDSLTKQAAKDIAVNLNFDMVGSPNYVRFVYDGDASTPARSVDRAPASSRTSSATTSPRRAWRTSRRRSTAARTTTRSSASASRPAACSPAPRASRRAEQAAIYGGTAGLAYDPCYHQACDDIDNISTEALDEMSDATAHATLTFAKTTSAVQGTDKGQARARWSSRAPACAASGRAHPAGNERRAAVRAALRRSGAANPRHP